MGEEKRTGEVPTLSPYTKYIAVTATYLQIFLVFISYIQLGNSFRSGWSTVKHCTREETLQYGSINLPYSSK